MDKPTCGPLYFEGLKHFTDMNPEITNIYAAGFAAGQAEKIYLGACSASMCRPSPERVDSMREIVKKVASIYGLFVTEIQCTYGIEIWMCKFEGTIDELLNVSENSSEWHTRRGLLCGVPAHQIDHFFHQRTGHGERCD